MYFCNTKEWRKKMTENELSLKLRADARKIGLCDEWYGQWKEDTSREELYQKFIRGLDFCLKHKWPSRPFIKHHFSQKFLRDHGILVDDTRSYPVRDENRRLIHLRDFVLLGESHATIRYSFKPHMCNIWVCDDSTIKVDVKYGAFMLIHLFDHTKADIVTDMVSNVTVIRHSPDTIVKKTGIVVVKNEYNYLR